jgi:uncharacterized protein (TIRG00374 family)
MVALQVQERRSVLATIPLSICELSQEHDFMKRAFFLILGIVVSVACFAWSLQDTNAAQLKAGFSGANYWTLPIMLLLLFGFYWLKTLRWQALLAPVVPLTFGQLFSPLLIGFAANNLLPAHLGEFIRVFVVRKKYGVSASTVLSTVVLERIFDVLAILALFGVGLLFTDDLPDDYRRGAIVLAALAGVVVFSVVVYLIWTDVFLRFVAWCFRLLPFLPAKLTDGILDMLRKGADGLAALRSGKAVVFIVITSLLQWLLNGMIAYVALRAFQIDVTVATGLIVTGVTAFGVTIPSTPGYFGVIQMCFQVSMKAQQIDPDPSLVLGASVYYQMSMYIPVTILGLYFAQQLGLSFKDLQRVAEDEGLPEAETIVPSTTQAGV